MDNPQDLRRYAPATERNREPILAILQQVLPPTGTILEISSGTGEHSIFMAPQLAPRQWLPSDPDPVARASIKAWQQFTPVSNLHPPIDLDASSDRWLVESKQPVTAIVNINMIHIAPKAAYLGLFAGAQRILRVGGILYLYGPFKQGSIHTAPSNAAFDESLRSRNSEWGVRDLEEIIAVAESHHLELQQVDPMPANNLSVVFRLSK
jgi:cyclopropane fatty-acyl-phospholipid synthase-like methyltransferase